MAKMMVIDKKDAFEKMGSGVTETGIGVAAIVNTVTLGKDINSVNDLIKDNVLDSSNLVDN